MDELELWEDRLQDYVDDLEYSGKVMAIAKMLRTSDEFLDVNDVHAIGEMLFDISFEFYELSEAAQDGAKDMIDAIRGENDD